MSENPKENFEESIFILEEALKDRLGDLEFLEKNLDHSVKVTNCDMLSRNWEQFKTALKCVEDHKRSLEKLRNK